MKIILVALTLVILSCGLAESTAAQQKKNRNLSISTSGDDKVITDCGQIKIRFRDVEAIRSEQLQSVPRSAISVLQVGASQNGGVHVQGWDRDEYAVKACLATGGDSAADANALLAQLKLSIHDGKVRVDGPNPEDWVAYLIIRAPREAVLDLTTMNGPIGVSEVTGSIQARASNGPITFRDVSGTIKADVQNGPITVTGGGGDFRLSAENGPLTVALLGSEWSSGTLEGSTQNGPLTLIVPESYQSSVRVNASKHSPVQCRASQCREAARTWDHPSRIQFGSSDPVIRLSTVNGPVTITSPKN